MAKKKDRPCLPIFPISKCPTCTRKYEVYAGPGGPQPVECEVCQLGVTVLLPAENKYRQYVESHI